MRGVGTALLGLAGQAPFRPTPTPPPHDAPSMSGTTSTQKGPAGTRAMARRRQHASDQTPPPTRSQSNTQRERLHQQDRHSNAGSVPGLRQRDPRRVGRRHRRAGRLPRRAARTASDEEVRRRVQQGCWATGAASMIRSTGSATRCAPAPTSSPPGRSTASRPVCKPATPTSRSPSPGAATNDCGRRSRRRR